MIPFMWDFKDILSYFKDHIKSGVYVTGYFNLAQVTFGSKTNSQNNLNMIILINKYRNL